jgi:hypothetical protein
MRASNAMTRDDLTHVANALAVFADFTAPLVAASRFDELSIPNAHTCSARSKRRRQP